MRTAATRLGTALVCLVAARVQADDGGGASAHGGGFLHDLAAEAGAQLDALRAAHAPQLVPPVPVALAWHPVKLAPALDLGAPLVALAAADLDGDGKAELYAVTGREVIAIGLVANHVKELGRVAFAGERAVPESRDVVGAATVVGRTLVASVSRYQRGLRVSWKGKTLVGDVAEAGFELCPGEHAQLVPGRDYFGDAQNAFYAVRCRTDLVDAEGHPLHLRAQLSAAGKLDVAIERCAAAGDRCQRTGELSLAKVGTAFDLADLDRDGRPEVVYASANAPGDSDEVRLVTLGEDEHKAKHHKSFVAEGVAGIAVGDVDGDGKAEVIAASRIVGSDRTTLWRMN